MWQMYTMKTVNLSLGRFTSDANRTRMRLAKMMWMFDVDMLPRRGKQHSVVPRTFGKQPNTIHQLSVLQREFAYDTFRCTRTWFIFIHSVNWHLKNAANSFTPTNKPPGNMVYSLRQRMSKYLQMHHIKRLHRFHMPFASFSHAAVAFHSRSGVNLA